MIEKQYLIPEFYINKVPKCDECKVRLEDTGARLLVDPPLFVYKCPNCGDEYKFYEEEIRGEWKWRTI